MIKKAAAVDIGSLIVSRPGVNGGRPCMAGTGTSVHQMAVCHNWGWSAEQILDQYPHLTPALVHAALAYYFANRKRIEADLAEEERLYDELSAKYPNGWGPAEPARE